MSVGANPQDVAITQDGLFTYLTNRNTNNVSVISTTNNTVMSTVAINTGFNLLLAGIAIAPSDTDSDGVLDMFADSEDNCPETPNSDQRDIIGNGLSDLCDPDYIFADGLEGSLDN